MTIEHLNLADLKAKTPAELLSMAEEWEIENAPSMRKGEMMFSILKEHAEEGWEIGGDGVLEVLQDGFGFLRSTSANYLPGPDDIYVSADILRQFSLRTGDTIEGLMQKEVVSLTEHSTIREAAEILGQGKFHSLPVLNGGKIVGMVTSTDLIRYLADQF